MAGVRARAAALIEDSGFMDGVRELLRAALAVHADETPARAAGGQSALEPAVLEDLLTRYRALTTAGLAANLYRRTATAKDARCLARRFRIFEDLPNGASPTRRLRDLFNGHTWKPPGLEPAG